MKPDINRGIERRRKLIQKNLLPDVCSIYRYVRVPNGFGGYDEQLGDPLLYKGSDLIPCRLDPNAHYRQAEIFGQESLVNEYTLRIPHDAPLDPDRRIVINDIHYEVRKIMEYHSGVLVKMALISAVE